MNMNVSKTNTGKLLVAVLAMAMVFAGVAVALGEDSSADPVSAIDFSTVPEDGVYDLNTGNVTVTGDPSNAGKAITINGKEGTVITLTAGLTFGSDVTFNDLKITYTGGATQIFKAISNSGTTVTFNNVEFDFGQTGSNIYVEEGNSAVFQDCTFTNATVAFSYTVNTVGAPSVEFNGCTGTPNLDVAGSDVTIGDDIITGGMAFDTITLYGFGTGTTTATNLVVPSGEVLNAKTITSNDKSTVTVEEGGNILVTDTPSEGVVKNDNPSMGISDSTVVFADDVVTFAGSIYLTGNLTIPEGKTLVFASGSSLNLDKYKLTIEGTLEVESGAYVMGLANGKIVLTPTGTVENQGVIGYQSEVKVTAVDDSDNLVTGSVTMMNVEGASFGIETTYAGGKSSSILTVSGDIYATTGNVSSYTITVDAAKIIGTFSIDDGVKFTSNDAVVAAEATFTLDGDMAGTGLIMADGSTVVINGNAGNTAIKAQTGKFLTSAKANVTYAASEVTLDNIAGVTLSVSSTTFTEDKSNKTEQVLYISGTATLIDDSKNGEITITNTAGSYPVEGANAEPFDGIAKVAADATLVLDEKTAFNGAGIIVLGEIQYPATTSAGTKVSQYVGTNYTVKESASVTTGYITAFEDALTAIDTAENKKITVYGELEIETGFELADGQTIALSKSDIAAVVTIGSDAKVTANKGSAISGAIEEVEGILFVQKGASVTKPVMYAVSGTNATTGDVTYAGFEAALANSVAGDKITVVAQGYENGTLTVKNSVEIPADRTVVIDGGKTIAFEKNLTVAEGAELVNKGTVKMTGEKATITVNGTFDNTAGQQLVFDNEGGNVNVSGEYIVANETALSGLSKFSVNGAYYDNKGKIVVTTFAKAVAGAAEIQGDDEITVIGKVSESGEVTVSGDYVTISGEATLGTIRIADTTVTVDDTSGTLTATIVGSYGTDGSTSDASVALSKVKNLVIKNASDVDAMNVTSWYTSISAINGTVAVQAGTIVIDGADVSTVAGSKLTVASGATLQIAETGKLTIAGAKTEFTVDGTLDVEGEVVFDSTTSAEISAVINGTMDITGTVEADKLVINGTVNVVSDENDEGSFSITDKYVTVGDVKKAMGATGSIIGIIGFEDDMYVIAYAGTDMSGAKLANDAEFETTAFYVNDALYATVYAATEVDNPITNEMIQDIPGISDAPDAEIKWTDANGEEITVSTIGQYETVYIDAELAEIKIKVSVGTGISLYIDNVKVDGPDYSLTIGTHTVSATVNPGYAGEVTISFNGQTVTGGSIDITVDSAGVVLSALGEISVDTGSSGSSDGMGLTEILLIILVVLIVVMAIMVALRLMRS